MMANLYPLSCKSYKKRNNPNNRENRHAMQYYCTARYFIVPLERLQVTPLLDIIFKQPLLGLPETNNYVKKIKGLRATPMRLAEAR